jgi:dihydroorotate dehydrogenase (NAD+) catalytic subunit
MANVSGFSVEDYAYTCRRLDAEPQVGWLEVNISCPNVHGGGMSFGTDPKAAAEVTAAVKKVTTKPVILKLSPNVTDIVSIAKACEDAGADGISLINTMLGMRIDLNRRRPVIANKMGGFSGSAIFPIAVRMVYQVANAVKVPVVGMGGVSSAEDVLEMMMAGATAVEVGAANLVNPYICRDIVRDLPHVMEKYRVENLCDIIGGVK